MERLKDRRDREGEREASEGEGIEGDWRVESGRLKERRNRDRGKKTI